jgi:hydrogenase maturation protein HypF
MDAAFGSDVLPPRALQAQLDARAWKQVLELLHSGVASPITTSMGRLFDAVAAICALRTRMNYEGQAAIELEAASEDAALAAYDYDLTTSEERLLLDPRPTIRAIVDDLARDTPVARIAGRFHATVAAMTVEACLRAASQCGTELVVLSGGVFHNRRLIEAASRALDRAGLRVLTPELLPAGDGGIAFGQAAIAARLSGG